jgi:hypothetical protein
VESTSWVIARFSYSTLAMNGNVPPMGVSVPSSTPAFGSYFMRKRPWSRSFDAISPLGR